MQGGNDLIRHTGNKAIDFIFQRIVCPGKQAAAKQAAAAFLINFVHVGLRADTLDDQLQIRMAAMGSEIGESANIFVEIDIDGDIEQGFDRRRAAVEAGEPAEFRIAEPGIAASLQEFRILDNSERHAHIVS